MKHIIIHLLSLLFSLMISCNGNLNEVLYSDVTETTYTYTDVYQATGIVYANLRSLWGHRTYYGLQETSSDEVVMPANASGWDDGGIYKRIHLHTWNSENPQLNNLWTAIQRLGMGINLVILEKGGQKNIRLPAMAACDFKRKILFLSSWRRLRNTG